ncbi:MAG: hypothetical protein KBC53_10930 [Nitrosomonas sp.]|nr:hypothetical protein [Nitrosomonas sp.]
MLRATEYKTKPLNHLEVTRTDHINKERSPFVILNGPSAVGKSTLMSALISEPGSRYRYVSPFTTRPLRTGETDKVSVSRQQFDQIAQTGGFVSVQNLYEHSYGTPIQTINRIVEDGKIPILDFPLNQTHVLLAAGLALLPIYILPESIAVWYEYLADTKRNTRARLAAGIMELRPLAERGWEAVTNGDLVVRAVTNINGNPQKTAANISDFLRNHIS